MRGKRVVTERRADAVHFIGSDARTHAAAANDNPSLGRAAPQGLADSLREIRVIVVRHKCGCAAIEDDVPQRFQFAHDDGLEMESAVVASDRNLHDSLALHCTNSIAHWQTYSTLNPYSHISTVTRHPA
jgi:hypothetical protein